MDNWYTKHARHLRRRNCDNSKIKLLAVKSRLDLARKAIDPIWTTTIRRALLAKELHRPVCGSRPAMAGKASDTDAAQAASTSPTSRPTKSQLTTIGRLAARGARWSPTGPAGGRRDRGPRDSQNMITALLQRALPDSKRILWNLQPRLEADIMSVANAVRARTA